MDQAAFIRILIGLISFVFSLATVYNLNRIKTLEKIVSDLHLTYAKREDVQRDFDYIKAALVRIESKLDGKADK